jgi:phosphoglycolate phosphatase-like HAD superfamily hydrolase
MHMDTTGDGRLDLRGYEIVIFDKDGTLIDFHAMWSAWMEELAARLETETGRPLQADLYAAMGYDAAARRTLADGWLAATPMARLWDLTAAFLQGRGLARRESEAVVAAVWFVPDPVATARPLADLPTLFGRLRAQGLKLAVATTDDRAPTMATLQALGAANWLDKVICADDGVRVKPAPDMVLEICRGTGTTPERALVVGDALHDMAMAREAGARAVGVLTGVTGREALARAADVVLESIASM